MSVIEARKLVKRYQTGGQILHALQSVDFSLDAGEFVSIMGPSGSGKTTLLNILGLLATPSEGSVTLHDRDVTHLSDKERTQLRKRTIGFVFQHFYLLPTLSAVENVEVPRLFDRDPDRTKRARTLLERVGLGDRLDHRPDELSGGQKQRVAIARSLINDPTIVLADEPTGNLDRETGRQILDEFKAIADRENVGIVAVTHDELVNEYVDRTVRLVDGQIRDTEQNRPAGDSSEDDIGTVVSNGDRNTQTRRGLVEATTDKQVVAGSTDDPARPTGDSSEDDIGTVVSKRDRNTQTRRGLAEVMTDKQVVIEPTDKPPRPDIERNWFADHNEQTRGVTVREDWFRDRTEHTDD